MSVRFNNQQRPIRPTDDAEIVSALVSVLADVGIARSRIDAIISKAARPAAVAAKPAFDHDNSNRDALDARAAVASGGKHRSPLGAR